MKVLARIPALETNAAAFTAAATGEAAVSPSAAGMQDESPCLPASRRTRSVRRGFPSGSVLTLAILAAVAWSLASWNDARRAERGRLERLARTQPAATSTETISR